MANAVSGFFCALCDIHFKHLSKYERHLTSATHRRFEESLNMMSADATTSSDPTTFMTSDSTLRASASRVRVITVV